MKLLLVFASVILAVIASTDEDQWVKFKEEYGKTYKSLREDKLRFEVFKSNLREIEEHNAKYEQGEKSWYMGINQFSDLTQEEFEVLYLSPLPSSVESDEVVTFNLSAADSIDWRAKGAVLSVKNQGSCGSCWSFSAVGALEGQNAIKHGIKTDLSEQELVDCATASKGYRNEGCSGGLMDSAFSYVKDHGLSTLSSYPYKATDGRCASQTNSGHIKVTGFRDIARSEAQLQQAVASVGPISIGIAASRIKQYKGGVFNDPSCGYSLNHGVLAVGYGKEGTNDIWIVKNSWGSSWGESGYIKMSRNRNNQCGISSMASYPVLA